jgi:hypothetical protein
MLQVSPIASSAEHVELSTKQRNNAQRWRVVVRFFVLLHENLTQHANLRALLCFAARRTDEHSFHNNNCPKPLPSHQ